MKRRIDSYCKACGLYKHCKTPRMEGEGSDKPLILFVGEAPGATEDQEGMPFCGTEGLELRETIESVGIPIQRCRFTNAVRCRPPENDLKVWPNAVDHCRVHLLREIRSYRPKVVVLIGNAALKSALGKSGGILKMHGQIIDVGYVKYVCMFHPGYLLRNRTEALERKFREALKTAKRIALGKAGFEKKVDYLTCKTKQDCNELHDIIEKSKYPATDAEMSMLTPFSRVREPKLGVVSFSWDEYAAACLPIHTRTGLSGCQFSSGYALEVLKAIWEMKWLRWLAHNGKTDMLWGIFFGIWLGGKGHKTGLYADTMLGSYALNHLKGIHDLKTWGNRVGMPNYDQAKLQYCMEHPEANPDKDGNLLLCPADILYPYNMNDSLCTRRAFFKQRTELKERDLWDKPFMFPLMYHHWTALQMELAGVGVDANRNAELDQVYHKRIKKVDDKLYKYAEVKQLQREADDETFMEIVERVENYARPIKDEKKKKKLIFGFYEKSKYTINVNSPDIKRKLLFEKLGFPVVHRTKKSNEPCMERWVLEEMAAEYKHPIIRALIKRGEYFSMHAKYVKPVPDWIGIDGKTHTLYKIHGTDTGRPSSENPNHLNLPARSRFTDEIMSQFIVAPGHSIIKQDSKQIELRLLADRAQDKVMMQEFNQGKDPHAMGAQAAYRISPERWAELEDKIKKKLRGFAKNAVSFGLVYGRLAAALAADFGWPLHRAEKFKEAYFSKYIGIWNYLQKMKQRILKDGFVKSNYGRIRNLPDAFSYDEFKSEKAVREGINSPIQGDASDINFIAAYRMARWMMKNHMRSKVIVFVYDAVYIDAADQAEMTDAIPQLHEFMTDRKYIEEMTGWRLGVPLDTDCSIGPNLGPAMIELKTNGTMDHDKFILPEAA